MTEPTCNSPFIRTGNSARPIMAEGLVDSLGGSRFKACSAGSHQSGGANPLALQALKDLRIPTDGLRSKSREESAAAEAPPLHFVFTVCDNAAGEVYPVWPGQPMTVHRGVPDPAEVEASEELDRHAFKGAAVTPKRRIAPMPASPLAKLEPMAIQYEIMNTCTA